MLLEDPFEINDDDLRKKIVKNTDINKFIIAFSLYFITLLFVIIINRRRLYGKFKL